MTGCLDNLASYGSYFRMAVKTSNVSTCVPATFDASSERYEILNENIRYTDTVVGSNGLTGTLDRIANHLRTGTRILFGRVVMEVGPNELVNWLPRILGNDAAGTTYSTAPDHTLKPFDLLLQRDYGTVIARHCIVARALFQGRAASENDPDVQVVRMALDIVGIEEHDASWPDPGPSLPTTDRLFWLFGDSVLKLDITALDSVNPTVLPIDAFNLLIDNNLQYKTRNSLKVSHMRAGERVIRLQVPTPYTEDTHDELYIKRFDGTGRLELRGDKNLAGETEEPWLTRFEFARLFQQRQTPATRGRGEIPLSLDLTAYRTHDTEPLIVTNKLTA